jgi:hypothetical protein
MRSEAMFLATPSTRQELTASHPPFNPLAAGSLSTSPGRSCSAAGDGSELLAQAPDVFSLRHTLSPQERSLMRARRIAGVTLPMSSDMRQPADEEVMSQSHANEPTAGEPLSRSNEIPQPSLRSL